MQVLTGTHVPRFVAAGDLDRVPYLVMEYVQGHTLQHWLDASPNARMSTTSAQLGAAMAQAAHACTSKTRCTWI